MSPRSRAWLSAREMGVEQTARWYSAEEVIRGPTGSKPTFSAEPVKFFAPVLPHYFALPDTEDSDDEFGGALHATEADYEQASGAAVSASRPVRRGPDGRPRPRRQICKGRIDVRVVLCEGSQR